MIYMNEPLEFVFRFRRVSGNGSIIGLLEGGKSLTCKTEFLQLTNHGEFSGSSFEIFERKMVWAIFMGNHLWLLKWLTSDKLIGYETDWL